MRLDLLRNSFNIYHWEHLMNYVLNCYQSETLKFCMCDVVVITSLVTYCDVGVLNERAHTN